MRHFSSPLCHFNVNVSNDSFFRRGGSGTRAYGTGRGTGERIFLHTLQNVLLSDLKSFINTLSFNDCLATISNEWDEISYCPEHSLYIQAKHTIGY